MDYSIFLNFMNVLQILTSWYSIDEKIILIVSLFKKTIWYL
jgi:hypothetical protein